MSGYYLCRTECAVRPFYIESIGRNIYSLEELCYYFSHYVYLIDESVVNVTLCRWIGTELGLVKLQNRLLRALERETYTEFLSPIFQECGYLISTMFYKKDSLVEPDYWYANKYNDWIVYPWEEQK